VRIDGPPREAPPVECPYLPERTFVQRYFFGVEADGAETGSLQAAGWRRFGSFFFRPDCPGCRACLPVRLDAAALTPTDSQRRVWRRNQDVEFAVAPLAYRDEYFEVYRQHSLTRFGKQANKPTPTTSGRPSLNPPCRPLSPSTGWTAAWPALASVTRAATA